MCPIKSATKKTTSVLKQDPKILKSRKNASLIGQYRLLLKATKQQINGDKRKYLNYIITVYGVSQNESLSLSLSLFG